MFLAALSLFLDQAAAALDQDPLTVPDWGLLGTAIALCVSGFFARDRDKSSEDEGVR